MSNDIQANPVFVALQKEVAGAMGAVASATVLWQAAGRPRNKSPRRYFRRDEIMYDEGGGADGHVFVQREDAIQYAANLDEHVMDWVVAEFMRKLHADPVRHVLGCPVPLMGIVATAAVMSDEGVDQHEAAAQLVGQTVERTASLGTYSQETSVARVQRALRGEPTLDEPR